MRILLLITQLELAGAQKAIFQLARGLSETGHHVLVVACYDKGQYLPHFAARYGVEVVSLAMKGPAPEPRQKQLWRAVRGVGKLLRLLRQRRIQILQSYTHYSNWLAALVGPLAGVPHCVTSQRGPLKLLPRWAGWLDRQINNSPWVDKMVAVSHATLAECRANGIRQEKLILIHNGIDFDQRECDRLDCDRLDCDQREAALRMQVGLAPTDRVVLTVARLHPQKGHDTLLQAARIVVAQAPEVKFIWVGEGELASLLVQERARLGLERQIMLVGARTQVQPYYQMADLLVLASRWEGLPNVLLEAAAHGLPIVATQVGGVAEIFPENAAALVPPDCPLLLAQAILESLSNPAHSQEMAQRAGRYVRETFTQCNTLQAYLQLYATLAAGKSA